MRSLLFLLLVLFSTLATVHGDDMRYEPGSDVEMSWYRATAGKSMEDTIQKLLR